MTKLKNPLLSLSASNTLGKVTSFVRRRRQNIAVKKPIPDDPKSPAQLSWRHMYQKCAALWHALSAAEQQDWNSLGGIRHMTGFAYWQSQCLRPNPGIYLPLQGGTMQGAIDMDSYQIEDLPHPAADSHAARKKYVDDSITASLYTQGARAYHNVNQAIPNSSWTAISLNSERYDTDNIHDTVTNNSRFTCRTAGKYIITAHASFAENATGVRYFKIYKGGTTTICLSPRTAQTGMNTGCILSTIYDLAVDDYIEFMAYQTSGSPLNILSSAQHSPEFSMQRIG